MMSSREIKTKPPGSDPDGVCGISVALKVAVSFLRSSQDTPRAPYTLR